MSNSFGKSMGKNIIYAYSSQAISMIIGVIFTLILPKVLGVEGYGYWQLMIMYISYIGITYIGLNDGLYLKNGGKKFEELNFPKIKSQIILFLIIHIGLSIGLILTAQFLVSDLNKRIILILVSIYIPVFNMKGILDQQFQASNRIEIHSISAIIDRVFILVLIIIFVILDITDFRIYSIVYIIGGFVALLYIISKSGSLFRSNFIGFKDTIKESKKNILNGFPLMLSSFISMMIIGSSRQLIELKWGIEAFSIVSLSMSLLNLFLVFVTKSGMVLFPSIRTLSSENRKKWYSNVLNMINIIIPLVFLVYLPLSIFIDFWLPQYSSTIFYLGILFPIVIFETKMTVLGTTFLKVYNKQKSLLFVNLIILVLNIIFALISVYYFENINLVVYGIVFSLALRSVITEFITNKVTGLQVNVKSLLLVLLSIVFILLNKFDNIQMTVLLYVLIISYVLSNYKGLKRSYKELKTINKVQIS